MGKRYKMIEVNHISDNNIYLNSTFNNLPSDICKTLKERGFGLFDRYTFDEALEVIEDCMNWKFICVTPYSREDKKYAIFEVINEFK